MSMSCARHTEIPACASHGSLTASGVRAHVVHVIRAKLADRDAWFQPGMDCAARSKCRQSLPGGQSKNLASSKPGLGRDKESKVEGGLPPLKVTRLKTSRRQTVKQTWAVHLPQD